MVVDDEVDPRDLIKRVLSECDAEEVGTEMVVEVLLLTEKEKLDVRVSEFGMPDGYGWWQRAYQMSRLRSIDITCHRVISDGNRRDSALPGMPLLASSRSILLYFAIGQGVIFADVWRAHFPEPQDRRA